MIKPEIHLDNLDQNSHWLSKRYEIVIDKNVSPEEIWDYVYNPETWTASNSKEHLGLVFYNKHNRPETGAAFYQKETVSGVYADLRGHILYAQKPKVCVWTGLAEYRLMGVLPLSVPENGVIQIEEKACGSLLSHTVYLRIPNTLMGRLLFKLSDAFSRKKGFIPHTYKELEYFKSQLEK